jgi:hypothetical protein
VVLDDCGCVCTTNLKIQMYHNNQSHFTFTSRHR